MDSEEAAFRAAVEPWRREILAHCYRMCGSHSEAEDLVQDTWLRAWQAWPTFEGRASVRRWLHAIATHRAIDALRERKRRILPPAIGSAGDPSAPLPAPVAELSWVEPFPDAALPEPVDRGPEVRYSTRQSVALAFVVAIQQLTPQQRAVLLLRDVVGYDAAEVADQLGLSVPAVNSTLLRARTAVSAPREADPVEDDVISLVRRYVEAFVQRDLGSLVALLREDAVLSMPPIPAWFQGAAACVEILAATVMSPDSEIVLRPIAVNGGPGIAGWSRPVAGGRWSPIGIQVFTVVDGRIAEVVCFVGPAFHPRFGLADTP